MLIRKYKYFKIVSCIVDQYLWPHSDQLALPLQLVATISDPRLVGVEMTCVSASFGEPIKDGLSSHWRTAGAERASGTGEDQGDAQRIQIPLSDFGRRKKLSSENVFSYRRHKVEDKRGEQPPFSVCGDGATQGTHKCERRARKRLRCRETKLAAHLGCRSHQWKMQTSSPNFSSGKTCFFYTAFYLRGSHYSTTNKTVRLLRNCSKIYQESISINRCLSKRAWRFRKNSELWLCLVPKLT